MSRKSLALLQLSPLIIFPLLAVAVHNDLIVLSNSFGENLWLAPKLEKFLDQNEFSEVATANNKFWNGIIVFYLAIVLFIIINFIRRKGIYIYNKKYTYVLNAIYMGYNILFMLDDVDLSRFGRSRSDAHYLNMGLDNYINGQMGVLMLASALAGIMISIFSVLAEPKQRR